MLAQCPIRMRIALSFDLTPELLDVVTPRIPTLHDIRFVCIKTTSMLMVVVGFHIRSLREPALNGSHSQASRLGSANHSALAHVTPSPVDSAHIARPGAL